MLRLIEPGQKGLGIDTGQRTGRCQARVQCQLFHFGFDRGLVGARFAWWTRGALGTFRTLGAFRPFGALARRLAVGGHTRVFTRLARFARRTWWTGRAAGGVDRLGFVRCRTGRAWFALFAALLFAQWRIAARLPTSFDQATARAFVLTIAVTSLLSSTLLDHSEGVFFVYMGGLMFAGYRAEMPDAARQRAT